MDALCIATFSPQKENNNLAQNTPVNLRFFYPPTYEMSTFLTTVWQLPGGAKGFWQNTCGAVLGCFYVRVEEEDSTEGASVIQIFQHFPLTIMRANVGGGGGVGFSCLEAKMVPLSRRSLLWLGSAALASLWQKAVSLSRMRPIVHNLPQEGSVIVDM